jgi:hypothetical protein
MSLQDANARLTEQSLSAVVTRADGTVVDYGVAAHQ